MSITNTLENPPVNPIVGPGRSSNTVRHEREAYQEHVRAQAGASGGMEAIFQADFIFVQLPNKPVQLHRVAHGLFIQDALEAELSFTTAEYTHIPQEDIPGLWGVFEPAENPTYDARDKKTGTKFARHQNVGREVILVYDVKVCHSMCQPRSLHV